MISCDIQACVGCRSCEVACSTIHFGAVSPALARIRVAKAEETGIDLAVTCLSCAEKPCLECPSQALTVGGKGEILLECGLCNGCRLCVDACPIGAVAFHDDRPLFCDLCGGAFACVAVCPNGALSFHESDKDISLQSFLSSQGSPNEKRAHYASVQGVPMRADWKRGRRIDS